MPGQTTATRSSRAKGIRLWLQPERRDRRTGELREHAVWVIRDGSRKRSTGCGADELGAAERRLAAYIASQHRPERQESADPRQVLIADIIHLYARDVAPGHARPGETAARLRRLLGWWATPQVAGADLKADRIAETFTGHVADIRGATCRSFIRHNGSASATRRALEDLRAAVNHAHAEGLIDRPVAVTLPEKPPSRDRWLTRAEVARLVYAAWRYLEPADRLANGRGARHTRRHVARFALIALYTGTRKAAILAAAFDRRPGCGYIDLERGIWYRQPAGKKQTKKRQPPVPLPRRLLAHLRRWHRNGQQFAVEFNGAPIADIKTAFNAVTGLAGLEGITPHTFRHTAATWSMQNGGDPWKAAGYLGMSLETLIANYGHHHPDHLDGAGDAITRHQSLPRQHPDKSSGTK